MQSPDDRIEPGEEVQLLAYVGTADGSLTTGYRGEATLNLPISSSLGPVLVEQTGWAYLNYRVSLTFTVPSELPWGTYFISVRDETGGYIADVIGGDIAVGIPGGTAYYDWPLDEPLVAQLPDDAIMFGPDYEITVGELRRGIFPRCAWCLLDPSVLDNPGVRVIDATPSWATTTTTAPSTTTTESTETSVAVLPSAAITIEAPPIPKASGSDSPWVVAVASAVVLVCLLLAGRAPEQKQSNSEDDRVQEEEPVGASWR
jgi:hypothetical protein